MSSHTVAVTARPAESGGWELQVQGVGVTQVSGLDRARQQVIDLIETYTEQAASSAEVDLRIDLGGLEQEVKAAQEAVARAEADRRDAARALQGVASRLRNEKRLTVSDSAHILGVTRARLLQMVK